MWWIDDSWCGDASCTIVKVRRQHGGPFTCTCGGAENGSWDMGTRLRRHEGLASTQILITFEFILLINRCFMRSGVEILFLNAFESLKMAVRQKNSIAWATTIVAFVHACGTSAYDNGMALAPPLGWQTWCSAGPCGTDHCFDFQIRETGMLHCQFVAAFWFFPCEWHLVSTVSVGLPRYVTKFVCVMTIRINAKKLVTHWW